MSKRISLPDPVPPQETVQDAVIRLANLSALEYEQARTAEAERLCVRTSVLDSEVSRARKSLCATRNVDGDIEPHPHPIEPAQLLDDVLGVIRRFIVADYETIIAAVLWIALT